MGWKEKDVNGKDLEVFYCKESFSKEFISKIKDGDTESTKKFLEENIVSLEDCKFRDKPTESNEKVVK